ncbi:xylem serine proteinase 1-like, partial [Trifolium medium]|nr:xylem serine proteinase 1-like [Trifolium medium]
IKEYGGAGTIIALEDEVDASYTTVIAGAFVDINTVGKNIETYINSTKNPQAVIYKTGSTKFPAPYLATFSSRGPQHITRNILKVIIFLSLVMFSIWLVF